MPSVVKKMRDTLRAADLERHEINAVPLSVMYRLSALGLIEPSWRTAGSAPPYDRVKLTKAGLWAARRAILSKHDE